MRADEGLESSSDELIDIQIEDSLVRETLMSIDSANCSDDVCTIIGFALTLVFMIFLGIFGPSSTYTQQTEPYDIGHLESQATQIKLEIVDISSFNRAMSLALMFTRSEDQGDISGKIRYKYEAEFRNAKGERVHTLNTKLATMDVQVLSGEAATANKRIWSENIIDFASLAIGIHLDTIPKGFDRVYGIITIGHPSHTVFQLFFRGTTACLGIVILVVIAKRLCAMSIRLWHLEQKLTVPLVLLVILYDNPFFIAQAYCPSKAYIILNTILVSIFSTYFRFFILVLFDSLRYKNRKTSKCFFLPKILFAVVLFMSSVVHGIYNDISSFDLPVEHDSTEELMRWVEICLYVIYIVWVGISIALAAVQVDVTERYKFNMYLASCVTALTMLCIVHVLFEALSLFRSSSIRFVISYAVENLFVFLMAYFHYPFEGLSDKKASSGDDVGVQSESEDEFAEQPQIASIVDN